MKLDFSDKPKFVDQIEVGLVGNIYRCKGGNKTNYWLIVAVRENTVICLGLDDEGNVTSSSNYGLHVFYNSPWARRPIGRALDMPEIKFSVSWENYDSMSR